MKRSLLVLCGLLFATQAFAGAASITSGPVQEGNIMVYTIEATAAAAGQIDTLTMHTPWWDMMSPLSSYVSSIGIGHQMDSGDSLSILTDWSTDNVSWSGYMTTTTITGSDNLYLESADNVPRFFRIRISNIDQDAFDYTLTLIIPRK